MSKLRDAWGNWLGPKCHGSGVLTEENSAYTAEQNDSRAAGGDDKTKGNSES